MISRVAEHCYWLSRYLERAENTARILEVNQNWLLDFDVPLEQQWKPLLIICGIHDYAGPLDARTVQDFMTWERDNPCSIIASLGAARENARIIREVISADMWERLNYYHLWIQSSAARNLYENNCPEFYSQIKRINQLLHGIGGGTMSHGKAWDFFRFGSHLERACQTARILDVKYHLLRSLPALANTAVESAHWTAILKSCSGYEPFHKQRHGLERQVGQAVADFLILDPLFPRSVLYCVKECRKAAQAISARPAHLGPNETERLLAALDTWLGGTTIEALVQADLHESLTGIVNRIHDVGTSVYRTYFEFQSEAFQFQGNGEQTQSLAAAR